jgi:hypothetical protein
MSYVVRAFPLIKPVAELENFLATLKGAKSAELATFYGQYGISEEIGYLQQLDDGRHVLIVLTVINDVDEAAPRYQAIGHGFDVWFKQQVLALTGIDPNEMPLGPPSKQVFSWRAT